ncbi:MAG: hypothetical protein H7X91_05490 [Burkholderiales bacterium]|nr:hypothetical protein [Burkholderiales bacterium]
MKLHWLFALFLALIFTGGSVVAATAPDRDSQPDDPPARVGRISLIQGNVSFYSGDDWQRAVLNFPVTSHNAISTANGARAEIRIGSMALRIEENTELNLTVIDDRTIQLGVPKGSLSVSLRSIRSGEAYQIVTADTTIDLMRPGRFRIDADAGREIDPESNSDSNSDASGAATRVTVFHGLATATAGDEIITIRGDESALLAGRGPEFSQADVDDFDRWVLARDRDYEKARSAEAPSGLSPETTGYEELDRYGEWRGHTSYGSLWYPNDVPAGWAPYRNGYWSHVAPWGWSWIDYAPWGFAPFHYGRWVYHHNRWGWWPGHYAHRPVYAPALVAYVGHPHSSVSISFGSYPLIGWFPLAPYEAYYPGYGHSSFYLSHLNRGYVRHPIREHGGHHKPGIDFANRKFHQAVTVVPRRAFVNERPVAPSTIPVVASPQPALISGTSPPIAPLAPAIVRNTATSPTPSAPSPAIGSDIFGRTINAQSGLANHRLSPGTIGSAARNHSTLPSRPGAPAIVRTIPGNRGNNNGVAANRIPGAPTGSANAGQAGPAGRMHPGIPRGTHAIGQTGDGRVLAPAIAQSRSVVRPPVTRVDPSTPSAIPSRATIPDRTRGNIPSTVRPSADPVHRRAVPSPLTPRAAFSERSGASISPSIGPSITRAPPAMRSAPVMRVAPPLPPSVHMAPAITGVRQNVAPPRAVAPHAAPQLHRPAVRGGGAAATAPIRGMSGLAGGGSMGRSSGGMGGQGGGARGFGAR